MYLIKAFPWQLPTLKGLDKLIIHLLFCLKMSKIDLGNRILLRLSNIVAHLILILCSSINKRNKPVSEFNEFEPRLKSTKNRFQLRAGLNLEKFNTILSETNHI